MKNGLGAYSIRPGLTSHESGSVDQVAAFLSNSKTLFTMDDSGRILRWFWPHIDYEQHVERISLGLEINGKVLWQSDFTGNWPRNVPDQCRDGNSYESYTRSSVGRRARLERFISRQRIEEGTYATVTLIRFANAHVEWRIKDLLLKDRDLLLRTITVHNAGRTRHFSVWNYAHLRISESPLANTVYFDQERQAIVSYRKGIYLGFNANLPLARFTCAPYSQALDLDVSMGTSISQGDVFSLASWDLGEIPRNQSKSLVLAMGAAESKESIEALLSDWLFIGGKTGQGIEVLTNQVPRYVEELTRPLRRTYEPFFGSPNSSESVVKKTPEGHFDSSMRDTSDGMPKEVQKMLETSVLVLDGLRDSQGGGFIAGPEFDQTYSQSGGYGYCWGRDASYIAIALDTLGYYSLTRDLYLKWALKAQSHDGGFLHRHYSDGVLAPSWGFLQIDETGSILVASKYHAECIGGKAEGRSFLEEFGPCAIKAAQYLLETIDPSDGLPIPCFDLWEERIGKHLYTAAAVAKGLEAGAFWAHHAHREDLEGSLRKAQLSLERRIIKAFWDESRGIFKRSLSPGFADETPDASILGIVYPFGILNPLDEKARSTVERIEAQLTSKHVGGLFRYAQDTYAGGNPWIVTTLWLGLLELLSGQKDKAKGRLQWALNHKTSLGFLPEQVDKASGEPKWVIPLAWSHAMFILLAVGIYGKPLEGPEGFS